MNFKDLHIHGEVRTDLLHRILYSTDASAYRETPLAVAFPKDETDVQEIVRYASRNHINLIPRAGGTSLAGQVVGKGLVVDISKYMNHILEINPEERWVRVQPGVVLDELNLYCKLYGLFFGPETSTSNRCCLGGMVGNNSCGSHSLVYGSTRDHLLEAKVILSDGSEALFLNLKEEKDRKLFRTVATKTAELVKKHRGSLSGEHGDGRLRGEFIPLLLGDKVYSLLKEVKEIWDSPHIFNMGKIVDTPPMDANLRYEQWDLGIDTYFDYSRQKGWLCAIEQCNGSGDCRKSGLLGGTMCPTYRATRDERNTTRARANTLRELLIHPLQKDIFNQEEILTALDTCVSCKACKSECPSNVDMARFKAEYLQHHYDNAHIPLRSRLIANLTSMQKLGMAAPWLYNAIISNVFTSSLIKRILKFAPQRSIPKLYKMTLRSWMIKHPDNKTHDKGKVYLFADEFTNYTDVGIGIKFIKLLRTLGYEVIIPKHVESGRTELSKGFLKRAKGIAEKNIVLLKEIISEETPLIGIEPSCILAFRDEYPDLVNENTREDARRLAANCLLYDEFIVKEIHKGNITQEQFTDFPLHIKLHGHCHQKSLASIEPSKEMLALPENYQVDIIPSGCCGMAGAFGYEKEHYALSMQIGEQSLFPAVRQAETEICISAPGTSCRQQIKDGTGRQAYHPIEILYDALL